MTRRLRVFGGAAFLGIFISLFSATAVFADAPDNAPNFLCPVVGDGVLNADAHNGDNGVAAIGPAVGTSLLPGGGAHTTNLPVAGSAINPEGPGNPDAGPGNPGFRPIWPI